MIDLEGQPVMRFLNIPDVLSSQYPGAYMEANERVDSRISVGDFFGSHATKDSIQKYHTLQSHGKQKRFGGTDEAL